MINGVQSLYKSAPTLRLGAFHSLSLRHRSSEVFILSRLLVARHYGVKQRKTPPHGHAQDVVTAKAKEWRAGLWRSLGCAQWRLDPILKELKKRRQKEESRWQKTKKQTNNSNNKKTNEWTQRRQTRIIMKTETREGWRNGLVRVKKRGRTTKKEREKDNPANATLPC